MRTVVVAKTVDHEFMILVNGFQWGGDRDASGAGNATFPTVAEAIGAFRDCGNEDPVEDEDGNLIDAGELSTEEAPDGGDLS